MATRKRLPQQESRIAALEAARAQLIESGPQAVTLKAVAGKMGRTHANLLHHFGTAGQLQKALARYLAEAICATIADAVLANRAGIGSAREVVNLTFDAFARDYVALKTQASKQEKAAEIYYAFREFFPALRDESGGLEQALADMLRYAVTTPLSA